MTKASKKLTKIFVVDDDNMVALSIKFSLHVLGYGVSGSASTGTEAIRLAGETEPDLVLMDIELAGDMDGITAASEIQRRFDVPVVYLTGQVKDEVIQRAKMSDSFGYLVKPFKEIELQIAIEMALYKYHTEKVLKESLTKIEQAKQEWESTADSLPQLVCLLDSQQGIIRANRTIERWNLTQVTQVKGKTLHDLLHPKCMAADCYLTMFINQTWQILANPETAQTHTIEHEVEDKILSRMLHFQVCPSSRTTHQHDMTSFAVVVIQDITERKHLEEQLRQSQRIEAVGRLAAGVAHDFNNVLMAISGDCELLLDELSLADPFYEDIEHIKQNAERGAALTKQLLAFGRKMVINPQVLNLNEILVNMGKLISRFVGEDIDLVMTTDPALGYIKAEIRQIEQIVMNLAINARDAMSQGGKLTIQTTNVNLSDGAYIKLAVSDTGTGIQPEHLPYIFDPFFTTKEVGKGTGLGLATVHDIVKQNGGTIAVDSALGQGTTFQVCFPRIEVKENNSRPIPSLSATPTDRASETILVVEDEVGVSMVVRKLLRKKGYHILTASNGQDALAVCQNYTGLIHLLITDMVMPKGLNGQELAERLKLLYPAIKVLFMSGYTDNDLFQQKMLKPGLAFLQKPFALDDLAQKVRQLLNEDS